jgi:hypothetical protein
MSNRRSIAMVGLAIAVVILAGVTHFARLPAWAIVLALVILAGASAQVLTGNHRREPAPFPQSAPVVPPPAEYRRAAIAGVPLPSSRPDYQFRFSASVLWLPATGTTSQKPLNLDAVAADVVLQRAREITRERDPELATLAQHDLARILGEMHSDSSGAVRAMAESVQLTLPDEDFQRLEKMAAIRKNEDIWEHERKYEQNRRKYLGEDALKSPGSAVVWWLARNDDQVDKVVPTCPMRQTTPAFRRHRGRLPPLNPRETFRLFPAQPIHRPGMQRRTAHRQPITSTPSCMPSASTRTTLTGSSSPGKWRV